MATALRTRARFFSTTPAPRFRPASAWPGDPAASTSRVAAASSTSATRATARRNCRPSRADGCRPRPPRVQTSMRSASPSILRATSISASASMRGTERIGSTKKPASPITISSASAARSSGSHPTGNAATSFPRDYAFRCPSPSTPRGICSVPTKKGRLGCPTAIRSTSSSSSRRDATTDSRPAIPSTSRA